MEIKFHLDEGIHPGVARGLRSRGIDVTTAQDAELLQATDVAHLAFANSAGRVLVTYDADFLRLHAAGAPHAGICYCHPQSRTLGEMIDGLLLVYGAMTTEDMKEHLEFL